MHHVTIKATVSLSHGAMAAIGLSAALKEQLTCSICLDVFTEPKTLQCLHSFCLPCLKKMAAKSPSDAPLRCPDCREDIRLPPEASLDTLPHSFYFDRLLKLLAMQEQSQSPSANICSCNRNSSPTGFCFDCEQFLCDECLNAHNFVAFLKGHRRLAVNQFQDADLREFLERPEKCKIEYHEKDKLEYFCEDCKSSICQKCALLEHRGHQYVYIRKAADQCKEGLRESVNKVKAKIPAVEERMKNAEESLNAGKQKIERVKGEVEERVEILIQLLRQHKHSVISELEGIEINETSRYEAKRCDLETRMAQLKSGVEFVDALLDRNLSNEIVDIHDSVIERCAELEADGGQNPEENHVEIEYKAPEVFTVTTAKFAPGRLLAPGFLDPSRSTIEGELKEAVVGQRAQFVVVTRDSQGKACSYGGDCVEVTVRSSTGEAVESTVLDKGDGRYEVHYTPQAVGRSEVVVEMSGRAVGGSPFEVQVVWEFKSLKTFGQAGSGAGEFNGPWGVAVSSMLGHVAVSDCNNHSIQLFTGDGQHLRTIGSRGSEKGQLLWPTGIAFDLQDRILVADDNHRIQVLTTAGQSLGTFGEKNLKHPLGICVTNEGKVKRNTVKPLLSGHPRD